MNWTQRTLALYIRKLARRLRDALTSNPRPIFRDRTVEQLHKAIAEAGPQLAATPVADTLTALGDALHALTATDLRQSPLLRSQTVEALAHAEVALLALAPSPFQETRS